MNPVIAPSAKVGSGVQIGYFSVIEADAQIAEGVTIGHHVVIHAGTIIGANAVIADHAVLGKRPQLARTSTATLGELPPLVIGQNCQIGTAAVLYTGTSVGEECLIADLASVRENCRIGNSVLIGRGVAVENNTSIGDFTKIQTNAYITAGMELEDHVFIAPMVTTTNDNFMGRTERRFALKKGAHIRRGARIGGNAVLLPGITIGEESFVAAGAVVTRNTPPRQVVMGIPAKVVHPVPDEELLP
ncbi:transferase family hexapeptide repeat protein [Hydrogenispora ethanolica]|uniref:Transferase family hexapeptide repeat protein n=1 Tax=Hydrogenispora ethanolica TaxID=1082276 RepID=A0A4R1R8U5_HYDET|nr:N-acetyltransferase [Hydrogenispora ethanolica]TCL61802.1 transferase family hexapeptide repeat protein [Hydrogenispora ethanolica]